MFTSDCSRFIWSCIQICWKNKTVWIWYSVLDYGRFALRLLNTLRVQLWQIPISNKSVCCKSPEHLVALFAALSWSVAMGCDKMAPSNTSLGNSCSSLWKAARKSERSRASEASLTHSFSCKKKICRFGRKYISPLLQQNAQHAFRKGAMGKVNGNYAQPNPKHLTSQLTGSFWSHPILARTQWKHGCPIRNE